MIAHFLLPFPRFGRKVLFSKFLDVGRWPKKAIVFFAEDIENWIRGLYELPFLVDKVEKHFLSKQKPWRHTGKKTNVIKTASDR